MCVLERGSFGIEVKNCYIMIMIYFQVEVCIFNIQH